MLDAVPAKPENPKTAATRAKIKNPIAQLNIIIPPHYFLFKKDL